MSMEPAEARAYESWIEEQEGHLAVEFLRANRHISAHLTNWIIDQIHADEGCHDFDDIKFALKFVRENHPVGFSNFCKDQWIEQGVSA